MPDATDRTAYFDERKLLIDSEREVAQSFDRTLTTLAASSLGLSITFIREIAPHPHREWILACSWVFLGLSLFAILIAQLASQAGLSRARDIVDARLTSQAAPAASDEGNSWRAITSFLNWTAIFTFMAGVAFLATFSFSNLP